MPDKADRWHLLQELRERRVPQTAAAYVIVAWLIVQAADILLPAFDAPAWAMRALVTALVLGLPLAVFLGWLYELTPEGVVRAPGLRAFDPGAARLRAAAAIAASVLTAGAIWYVWSGYFDGERSAFARSAPRKLPVVAVAELTNLTGDSTLDWLGEGLANLVRDGLAQSRHLIVVSPSRWRSILRNAAADADYQSAAAAAGIDYVFSGELLKEPQGLLITARVSDVEHGVEALAQRINRPSPEALLGEADGLVLLTKRGLKVPHTEYIASFAADFVVDNMAAYENYVAGLAYFVDFHYREAERAFNAALTLAPEFHVARYRLAHVQAATGRTGTALESLNAIPQDAPLPDRERQLVEGAKKLFARDAEGAKAIYSELLEQYPYDVEVRHYLVLAYDVGYEDEAALAELHRLVQQEPENDRLWSFLGETYLRLGRHEEARDALDRYRALKPRDPFGFTALGQLELLTGHTDAAAGHFMHALDIEADFARARLGLAQTNALQGRWSEAEERLRELIADEAASMTDRIAAGLDLSALLQAGGRFQASLEPLVSLEPGIREESVREALALTERGLAHIELGSTSVARSLISQAIDRSPGVPTRYLFARGLLRLAQNDLAGVHATAAEIRDLRRPAADDKRTEDKAAAYLDGLAQLAAGDAPAAVATLRESLAIEGYQYALYRLGLARALLASGELDEALALARAARVEREANDIRLDLELERTRALLVEARIQQARGDTDTARELAHAFLTRWQNADPGHPDLAAARRLAGR